MTAIFTHVACSFGAFNKNYIGVSKLDHVTFSLHMLLTNFIVTEVRKIALSESRQILSHKNIVKRGLRHVEMIAISNSFWSRARKKLKKTKEKDRTIFELY